MAAFHHLDSTIVRYLCTHKKDTFKRNDSLEKTIYCTEGDCKFLVKLLLISKVTGFKDNDLQIVRSFSYWLI